MTAENSDHQKPGALRIQNVVNRPTMPLIRNSQPMTMVKASVATRRHDDRGHAEKDQDDALDEKQLPVLVDCIGHRALHAGGIVGVHGHCPLPW